MRRWAVALAGLPIPVQSLVDKQEFSVGDKISAPSATRYGPADSSSWVGKGGRGWLEVRTADVACDLSVQPSCNSRHSRSVHPGSGRGLMLCLLVAIWLIAAVDAKAML